MKPALVAEETKSNVFNVEDTKTNVVVIPQHVETSSKSKRSRWIVGGIVGVVVFAAIAATVIVSVYFGTKISQDNFKEAWVTFSGKDINNTVQEKIVVTKTEQDITSPGKFRTIYDFKERMIVTQMIREGDENPTCYVSDWDDYGDQSTEQIMEDMTADNITRTASLDPRTITYESTGEEVYIQTLSPRAREMCFGCKVVKVTEQAEDGTVARNRRDLCYDCYLECSLYYSYYYGYQYLCRYVFYPYYCYGYYY